MGVDWSVDLIEIQEKSLPINYTEGAEIIHIYKTWTPQRQKGKIQKYGFTWRDLIAFEGNQVSLQLSSSPSSLPTAWRIAFAFSNIAVTLTLATGPGVAVGFSDTVRLRLNDFVLI